MLVASLGILIIHVQNLTKIKLFLGDFRFQVKTPIVKANSKVLVPGLPGHQAPVKVGSQGKGMEKRKKEANTKEVDLGYR